MIQFINIIIEATHGEIQQKQRTITKLFPQFPDRLQKVADNGGVKLEEMEPDKWHFYVASGTEKGTEYHNYVKFVNLKPLFRKYIASDAVWNKAGSAVDYQKLARLLLDNMDLRLLCTCPAFQYWGSAYTLSRSKYDAKYGRRERRPPNIRNPKEHGSMCKHMHQVMRVLPFYNSTFAKYLKEYHKTYIEQLTKKALKLKEKPEEDKEKKEK